MAEVTTQRIIEVDVRGVKTLAELQQELNAARGALMQLDAEVKNGTATEEEYQQALVQVKKAQTDYNAEMRIQVKENKAAKGSYNDLVNQLARLKEAWKQADPKTEEYTKLTEQVNKVKGELESMDHSIGNWQRNVGNYGNSIASVASLFGSAGRSAGNAVNGVVSFGSSLKALLATPVIAILGVLVTVLQKIGDAFKSSEEASNRLALALAPLRAGGQLLTNIMQSLANSVASAAEWLGKMAERLGLFTDKMRENQDITREEIELTKERRRVLVDNARIEEEVVAAQQIARDKANHSLQERIDALTRASELEKQKLANDLGIAQKEYEIAQRKAALTQNDARANDALAQAEANLHQVRANNARETLRITSQLSAAILEARGLEAKAAEETGATLAGIADSWAGKMDATIAKAIELRKEAEAELKMLNATIAEQDKELYAEIQSYLDGLNQGFIQSGIDAKKAEEDNVKERISTMQSMAGAVSSILDDVAGAWQSDIKARVEAGKISEEEGEKEFENVKAMQYANTWINTLAGVTAALANPMPLPWAVKAAQAAATLSAGIATTIKIANTKLGQTNQASASGQGMQIAPSVQMRVPEYRAVTSARDEEILNARTKSQKVVLVMSELEAAQEGQRVQYAESAF